jgi:hypothetical protein
MQTVTLLETALRCHISFLREAVADTTHLLGCASRESSLEHYEEPVSTLLRLYNDARCALEMTRAVEEPAKRVMSDGELNPSVAKAGIAAMSAWSSALEPLALDIAEAARMGKAASIIRAGVRATPPSVTDLDELAIDRRARAAARDISARAPKATASDTSAEFTRASALLAREWLVRSTYSMALAHASIEGAKAEAGVTAARNTLSEGVVSLRMRTAARMCDNVDSSSGSEEADGEDGNIDDEEFDSDVYRIAISNPVFVKADYAELAQIADIRGREAAELAHAQDILVIQRATEAAIESLAQETSRRLAALPEEVASACALSREATDANNAADLRVAKTRLMLSARRLEIVACWVRLIRLIQDRSKATRAHAVAAAAATVGVGVGVPRQKTRVLSSLMALGARDSNTFTSTVIANERKLQRASLTRIATSVLYTKERHAALEAKLRELLEMSLKSAERRKAAEQLDLEVGAKEVVIMGGGAAAVV